jgi:F0F1-type ATP synthase assembly protein I
MSHSEEPRGPQRRRTQHHFAMAMELPFVFVGAIVVAALVGWWLDSKLGTAPWLMVALGALGFYTGLREILRRLDKMRDNDDRGSRPRS